MQLRTLIFSAAAMALLAVSPGVDCGLVAAHKGTPATHAANAHAQPQRGRAEHGHGANDHDHDHDGHDDQGGHDDHHHHDHEDHDHGHDHHDHGHAHRHDHAHGRLAPTPTPTPAINRFSPKIWLEALFATALVGAAPVVVLLFVPLGLGNEDAQKPLLRVFLSFAAGGLLGDALLHLLPHSLPASHGHDHAHGHGHEHAHAHSVGDLAVWLWTIAGMMTFLMLEKFVRAHTGGSHGHAHGIVDSHGHSYAHAHAEAVAREDRNGAARKRKPHADGDDDVESSGDDKAKAARRPAKPTTGATSTPIAAAGYLNLAADFSHNFTDGLAIGATFLRGSGWQTTVAMLLHELPHEIGDFAILIQSGFTRREAMLTQLATAVGAMVGTVLGLLIEGAGDSSSAWISPFTAGGFIYIACASVMPELLEDCSLWQSIKEGIAMCLGIGLMVLIALNE